MSFFKAYDMRGTFGADFDLDTVYRVGLALPRVVKGRRWLVGRDCRTTSDAVHDALVKGLAESGAEVTDLGRCTTSMVYFFTAKEDFDGSVMITASHNPPTDNGLKVSMKTALPVGYANGLNEVERLVGTAFSALHVGETCGAESAPRTQGGEPATDAVRLARYIAWQREHSSFIAHSASLSLAVDCSNGMASILAHELFPGAVFLNDTPDGTFPAHSPNPLNAAAREQLARVVRERKLDCGVIFDGDADRAMFVDENGDFVQPDYLIPIVARATIRRPGGLLDGSSVPATQTCKHPNNPKIIHDVRTSRGAIETLREMGCEPVMVPVGHAFAKPILRDIKAVCGGELAGHYYFGEFFGCDSGVLAALRVLSEVAKAKVAGRTFSAMMAPIVTRYANSGELNFKVEDKDAAIARVLACAATLARETARSTMDGYRLEYDEGWISVRKSNTEPYLRLLVEADTKARLDAWVAKLKEAIEA